MNALRLTAGFETSLFRERTGLEWSALDPEIAPLLARGLLVIDGSICKPTALGLRFLNDLLVSFLPEKAGLSGKQTLSTGS